MGNPTIPPGPPPSYELATGQATNHQTSTSAGSSNTSYGARPPAPTPSAPGTQSAPHLYSANSALPFDFARGYYCKKCKNSGYRKGRICTVCWQKFYLVDHAYNPNRDLPFQYPVRYLCDECDNTGYRKGKACSDCWKRFHRRDQAYNPNPNLPFRYPPGYICRKCNNTGIKVKNGLSCQDCYASFGPRNTASYVPSSSYSESIFDSLFGSTTTTTTYYSTSGPPLQVAPGDPRMGGVLCGRCRGSGQISVFLDTDLCPLCHGTGRIFTAGPAPGPAQPFGQQFGPGPSGPYGPKPGYGPYQGPY